MKTIYCDICGDKVPMHIEFNHDDFNVQIFKHDELLDICENCQRQLIKYTRNWIYNIKIFKENNMGEIKNEGN